MRTAATFGTNYTRVAITLKTAIYTGPYAHSSWLLANGVESAQTHYNLGNADNK